ncbi:uncharacterized protein LOC120338225 [Styela clava]
MGNGCMRSKAVEVTSPTLPAFKVVVVGDSGSGKTSIVKRFVHNKFEEEYLRTTDVDITSVVKKLNVPEHAIVTVELWDVPGENDVDLRKTYYLDVDAVIVVVDISSEDSLNVAGSWSLDVTNHARVSRTFTESVPNPDGKTFTNKTRKEYVKPKPGSIPVLLLGNKYDLAKTKFMKELEASESQGILKIKPVSEDQVKPATEDTKSAESAKTNDELSENVNNSVENKNDSAEPKISVETAKTDKKSDEPPKESSDTPSKDTGDSSPKEETTPIVENGHVGNGGAIKEKEGHRETTYKKIHPKDERNGVITSVEKVQEVNEKNPSPADDAKSAVTSLVSLLPPCVEDIEQVAEKYGFLAGVPVSAKTVNGGVQEVMQSVLRRLVAKKLFNLDAKEAILERKKQNFDVASAKSVKSYLSKNSSRLRKKISGNFESLQEVGIIEIDEVIRRCNPTLHEAEDLTAGYAEAMHGFKLACFKNGFTSGTRVSLEVCIAALKEAVASNFDPVNSDPRENIKLMMMTPEKQAEREQKALTLISEDADGFPDLRIVNTEQKDVEKLNERIEMKETDENKDDIIRVQPKIMNVLTEYRENFLHKSSSISKYGAEVETILGKRTMELTAKEEKAWETAVAAGLSHNEVRRILSTIAQDKARLRGTAELVQEARKSVQKSAGKIKATLLF